jgi:hypothetical protein
MRPRKKCITLSFSEKIMYCSNAEQSKRVPR